MSDTKISLMYEEQQALAVIRKMLKRKPEYARVIMEGMAREVAVNVLLQAKRELADLLAVSQAFSAASRKLMDIDKKELTNDH